VPRSLAVLLAAVAALTTARAAPAPRRSAPETFLVDNRGLAFLGPDGREIERPIPGLTCGALSPDGRWLAGVEFDPGASRCKLVHRPRGAAGKPATIPLVWDRLGGSGCLPVWSADGRTLLVGENRPGEAGTLEYSYRVLDPATKALTALDLPGEHWVSGWSPDGKRFLTTARSGGRAPRVAWLNADGTGEPEYLTPAGEVAYGPRLSPDGRRVLYQAVGQALNGQPAGVRLYALDLTTKARTAVDEPGETYGYCWSADGARVAYTWQRPRGNWSEVPERETLLITCDPDGGHRKTVTSRKYVVPENSNGRSAPVYFFSVIDWR
jgi:WD40-like Beta Propeller Repeat